MSRLSCLGAALAAALLIAGCAPTHRLAEVQLTERNVAVTAPMPPDDRVVIGPWPFVDAGVRPPPGEPRRRFDMARGGQMRLDSAAAAVDVAEHLARRVLLHGGRTLGFRPVGAVDDAELVLDVRLLEFRFTASSFDSHMRVRVVADASLIRADTGELVWRRRFRERETVDTAFFDAPDLGRRLTPRHMTMLSTAELAVGLERLSRLVADRIAGRLQRDYGDAHR